MFPNMIVHFLYEEQRRNDEIRQIQLENEYHRALRNGSAGKSRNSRGLRSRYNSFAARLSAIVHSSSQEAQESGYESTSRDACPDPCYAS
jgi:hypothetical protein